MWSVHHYGLSFKDLSTNAQKMSDMLVEMSGRLLSDIVYAGSGYPNFPVAALGGAIKYRDIGTPDLEAPIVSSEDDLARLDMGMIESDPVLGVIHEALTLTRSRIGDDYLVTLTAWGPFTLGARLIGEEAMMKALFKKPSLVRRLVSTAQEILFRFFDRPLRTKKLEVVLLGEPTASGDLISKRQFEEFVLPPLQDFTDWARSHGAHSIVHICGNTTDRLDLFPLTGASCISLDHKTDIRKAREILGGKMCFGGNIDPVKVLLQGTAGDVEDAGRQVIEAAGTEGGFILMPGCDIPPTVPFENIQRFVHTARTWRY